MVLSACHSTILASHLVKHIDSVIAWEGDVSNGEAIAFAETFYEGIWDGELVQTAFEDSVDALVAESGRAGNVPRLLSRSGSAVERVRFVTPAFGAPR